MSFLNAKAHIALGQTFLLVTLLLAALALGLVPNREQAIRAGRADLAEAMAVSGSALVTQADLRRLDAILRVTVERNDELLSAAVRRADGRALASVGDHDLAWSHDQSDYSSNSQVKVPIWSRGQRWGQLEMRFRPVGATGWLGWVRDPRVQLVAFVGVLAFALFYMYLAKMLQHLDPAQAVPPHVRSALDTLAEGLLVMDTKERIVLANQAIATIVGRSAEALMGRPVTELDWVNADGTPVEPADFPWRAALADGEPRMNDIVLLRGDEDVVRTFIVNCSPVLGSSGSPGGVLISLDDVTQLEEHKAELSIAKEEAEAANQAKSQFLANMSHEIRTPLNAILGFTEVLKRGYVTDATDRNKYLETIRSSGEHLLELINDVLDLSKVESGHLELESVRFAPHAIVQQVVTALTVKAHDKGLALELRIDGEIPETLCTDPTRFRQIATNLLTNAIKFTNDGGVTVTAGLVGDGAERRFMLRVSDTGIGLPESSFESVFDEFVQADSSVTRRFGGTGLGLPISRRFARLMGGDISVCSVVGEGSTFTVTIDPGPLEGVRMLTASEAMAAADDASSSEHGSWSFPPARVLVVDDGEENLELLELVLTDVGLVIEGAENGQVGVDRALGGDFDLVLMDMQMPVMDGYTATRALRAAGFTKPIVALTADAMKGFERKCLDAGCTAFLTKPIDIDGLIESLGELLGGERSAEAPPTSQPTRTAPAVVEPVLSSLAGKNPRFAAIAEKFVGRLTQRIAAMHASLEERDFEALAAHAHWLKGSAGTMGFDAFHRPAQALEHSAHERSETDLEGLLHEIESLARHIVLDPGALPEPPASRARSASISEGPVTSRLASNDQLRAPIERFVGLLGPKLDEMDAHFEGREQDEMARLAHWLKGGAGMVGFDVFTDPSAQIEQLARDGKWSEIEPLLHEMRSLAERIELPWIDSDGNAAVREAGR